MPYPENPADCPKLEAWRDGQEYGRRDGDIGTCMDCPHQRMCVGSEISQMGNALENIQETLKETPRPLSRLAQVVLKTG
jgi:hypothetical protein